MAFVAAGALVIGATDGPPPADEPRVTARLEVETRGDCFTIRFFLRNDGDDDIEIIIGRGSQGRVVVPTFHLTRGGGALSITPPIFRAGPRHSMEPDVERLPARREVVYDAYTLAFPHSWRDWRPLMPHEMMIMGMVEFTRPGQPRRVISLRTEPVPFPVEVLPRPAR